MRWITLMLMSREMHPSFLCFDDLMHLSSQSLTGEVQRTKSKVIKKIGNEDSNDEC